MSIDDKKKFIYHTTFTCTVNCSSKNLNNVYNGNTTVAKPYTGNYLGSICEVVSMLGWTQKSDAQAQYNGDTMVYCSMISASHGNSGVGINVTVFYTK